MPRATTIARLHLVALQLVWGAWMVTTGLMLAAQSPTEAAATALVASLAAALLYPRLVDLAQRGQFWATRVVALASALGVFGLMLGLAIALGRPVPVEVLIGLRIGIGVAGVTLLILAPVATGTPQPFFLRSTHASDAIARKNLYGAAGHALLVILALDLARQFPIEPGESLPRALTHGAIAYLIAVVLVIAQRYPQRAVGFLPVGAALAAVALLIAWIAPSAEWPVVLLGFALGLGHSPPRSDLLACVPATQRLSGMMVMLASITAGALLGAGLAYAAPSPVTRFVAAGMLTAVAAWFYRRELIELAVEPILAITNPIRGHGPGFHALPTRGPVLVIANHAAWFDPLWIAKLVPLRLRPMMTSRFYDLPLIGWLMRRVFYAIRVPVSGFRREAPEIRDAIAALARGENLLIFPEGWLRRREDQPLKRFGQGIFQILREQPETLVVPCWIEGNWGSFVSFKNGPPTKNKRPDLFHRIRISIGEPQLLSPELLQDQRATRLHLMNACWHARTYLNLPEFPATPLPVDDAIDDPVDGALDDSVNGAVDEARGSA